MLKYFKDSFTNYDFAAVLQTISLLLFVVFFGALIYFVFKRPKEYYDANAHLPLDDQNDSNNNQDLLN
ncbi:MAG TPA: hypothetical protein VL022_00075 [Moheibacter sp.]|nr:hypothetical protein [Moheibacter sp.]